MGVSAGPGGSLQEKPRSRDLAAETLAGLGNLVVLLDPRGRIVLWNRECEKVTGCAAAEALGRPLWELFADAEDAGPFRTFFDHLALELFPWPCESRLRSRGRPDLDGPAAQSPGRARVVSHHDRRHRRPQARRSGTADGQRGRGRHLTNH
jgi:PAS domain-containing protein